jgi:hypothetical protein
VPSSPIVQRDATAKKSAGRSDGEEGEEARRRSKRGDIAAASTRRTKAAMVFTAVTNVLGF